MPIAAGEIITAARLNRLQPKTYSAAASANLSVTSTITDIAGATVTLNTETAGAGYVVIGTFDINQIATTNNDCFGRLDIDGVAEAATAQFGGQVSGDRANVSQTWQGALGAAGSHTLKLRASTTSSSQFTVIQTHTRIVIVIYEVV